MSGEYVSIRCAGRRAGVLSRIRQTGFLIVMISSIVLAIAPARAEVSDKEMAVHLAEFLRSARTVISHNQSLINSQTPVDKGLSGDVVVERANAIFKLKTGYDVSSVNFDPRFRRLLGAQVEAVREIVEEHQSTINKASVGFKGFVPAVFARLVNERFTLKMGHEVEIKVTAPRDLVRNRKSLPDEFETRVIETHLSLSEWPKNQIYFEQLSTTQGNSLRVLVPEYYTKACLSCHGSPKGELDITGYPKEGGLLDQLGGVISVQFFNP